MTLTRDKLVERIAKQMLREAGKDPDEICYGRKGDVAASMPRWYAMRPVANAILADLESAGLCIVPREPTLAMLAEGRSAIAADEPTADVYRDMIAAAGEG